MDLFDLVREKNLKKDSPLAERLRPTKLEDFVGQYHIIGEGKLLYRAIQADKLSSAIFYGPTGTGKTTLAKIIANTTSKHFEQLNAVTSGKGDIVKVVEDAKDRLGSSGKKTILFIDEIHRFNKLQQDALLPHVENGTIILIGATTENPYFEVNRALLSRSLVFKLEPLDTKDIGKIILRAIRDIDKGLGMYDVVIEEKTLEYLASKSNGDVRYALNAVELGVLTTPKGEDGKIHFTIEVASECIQSRALNFDKSGDNHYDTISAFIKSMRGSDPDAALYYLARLIESGEDLRFIARRIVICAAEDVGNADPNALVVANSAAQASDFVGLPEARIILAQAVTYIACAPKSNSSLGIFDAVKAVNEIDIKGIPLHLRDAHYDGANSLGHGEGYKYAHAYPNHYVQQQYLPDEVKEQKFYKPSCNGYEKTMNEWMEKIRNHKIE